MTEAAYEKIVDTVAAKYAKAGKISEQEIRIFANLLKQQWKGIVKSHNKAVAVKKAAKTVAGAAKKEVRKPGSSVKKKVAKKTS